MYEETGRKILGLVEYKYEGVRFLLRKGISNKVFIFFSSFSKKNESQKYNYVKKTLNNENDSFIFFLDSDSPESDPRGTYFIGDKNENYLKSIVSIISRLYCSKLELDFYFFGSSKGGSGALLTCLEFGKGMVLINAPQIKISEYLADTNPKAILEINKNENFLNNIIVEKMQKITGDININISCGIEDDLHWFSHIKHLIENTEKEVNIKIIPIKGGHDGKALNDYSILIDSVINESVIINDVSELDKQINFFRRKNKLFFDSFILPKLSNNVNKEDFLNNFVKEAYNTIEETLFLTVLNSKTIMVKMNGIEGVGIAVYAKDIDGKNLAKHSKYIYYDHKFILEHVSFERLHSITVFLKVNEISTSFSFSKYQIEVVNIPECFENKVKYLEYLSSECVSTTKKIIRNGDPLLLESAHILPSFIDSSESKAIVKNHLGYSFKTCITNALIKNYLTEDNKILGLFSKKETSDFLKSNGFEVPAIYEYNVGIENVLKYNTCIIKPINGEGSKGVFVKNSDEYLDLRDKEKLINYEDFKSKYNTYTGLNVLIEELVAEDVKLARDVKVYCFYGKAILALEVIRGGDKNLYCYYDENLNIVNTGQYKDSELFDGEGFDQKILDIARQVSLLFPLPFIRVDFLVSKDNFKLGEVTPIPGFYSRFNTNYDKKLGKEYLQAESRLKKDLLAGKPFNF